MYRKGDIHIRKIKNVGKRTLKNKLYLHSDRGYCNECYMIGDKQHTKKLLEDLQDLMEGLSED